MTLSLGNPIDSSITISSSLAVEAGLVVRDRVGRLISLILVASDLVGALVDETNGRMRDEHSLETNAGTLHLFKGFTYAISRPATVPLIAETIEDIEFISRSWVSHDITCIDKAHKK
jgi:hypothetical protein